MTRTNGALLFTAWILFGIGSVPAIACTAPIWNHDDPSRTTVDSEIAVFPLVQAGIELEYQIEAPGTNVIRTGRFQGPASPNTSVSVPVPALDRFPVLVGRLVDEASQPLAERTVDFTIGRSGDGGTSTQGHDVTTDVDGNFRFRLTATVPQGGRRTLHVRESREQHVPEATLDITDDFGPGIHELGTIILAPPGSDIALRKLDDGALEKRYREVQNLNPYGGDSHLVQTCLLEMARRGGKRWTEFLSSELDRIQSGDDEQRALAEEDLDVEFLTALRRAQRKPDPLVVEITNGPSFEVEFPDAPVFECLLRNVDTMRRSVDITDGGSYRGSRFGRVVIEATAEDGTRVPMLPGGMSGGGMSMAKTLRRGRTHPFAIAIGSYILPPSPGTYRMRVHYHDTTDIDSYPTERGWIVSSSSFVTVEVKPRTVRLKRREYEAMQRQIEDLPIDEPVPLCNTTWYPEMRFHGSSKTPEDRLFRVGYRAVPVLIEKLDDPDLEPKRRAWIFGMLWNITGLHHRDTPDTLFAFGNTRSYFIWPTCADAPTSSYGSATGPISTEAQTALSEKWKQAGTWFKLEIK